MGTIERHKSHQIWQVWTVKTCLSSPFLFSGIVHEWIEGMKKGKREGVKGRNRVCHEKGMMGVSSRTDKNKMMNQKSLHSDGTVEGQEGDSQQQTISNNITSVYYCSDNLSNYLGYFGQLCPSWFNHLRLGFWVQFYFSSRLLTFVRTCNKNQWDTFANESKLLIFLLLMFG